MKNKNRKEKPCNRRMKKGKQNKKIKVDGISIEKKIIDFYNK
jgi:hypothetical protein